MICWSGRSWWRWRQILLPGQATCLPPLLEKAFAKFYPQLIPFSGDTLLAGSHFSVRCELHNSHYPSSQRALIRTWVVLARLQLVVEHASLGLSVWTVSARSIIKYRKKWICSLADNTQNAWHVQTYLPHPCMPNFTRFPRHLSIKKNHKGKGMIGMKLLKNAFKDPIKPSCWKL